MTDTLNPLIEKLRQLQQLGDPVEVEFFPRSSDHVEVTIGTHAPGDFKLELSPTVEQLSWADTWVLAGALIEHALEQGHEGQADALLSTTKHGLRNLIDVRLEQLQNDSD